MLKRFLIALIFLLLSSQLVFAVVGYDDQGNPNDPNENERANACFDGGSIEGKCETSWEWECGWYLIQFDYNLIDREVFPTWCVTLLPPEIVQETADTGFSYPGADCIPVSATPRYTDFGGGNYLEYLTGLDNPSCTPVGRASTSKYPLVYAPEGLAAANDICIAHGHGNVILGPSGDNVYYCIR